MVPASSCAATPSRGSVITLINIVGGLFIGVLEDGMTVREASTLFTMLTIGDGLVSQVPALLISLAAGLLVTRARARSNLPAQFVGTNLLPAAGLGGDGRDFWAC